MSTAKTGFKTVEPAAQIVAPAAIVDAQGANGGGSIFSNLISKFYMALIMVGIILLFATIGSTSMDSLNGSIAGYVLVGSGILILVSYLLNGVINNKSDEGKASLGNKNRWTIMSIIYTAGPFLVLIGIVSYVLYLLFTFKDRIAEGRIAPGYINFTNISVILILLQLFLFYMGTLKQSFKDEQRLDRVYSGLLYFIGIINIVAVITIGIILKYFSTDG